MDCTTCCPTHGCRWGHNATCPVFTKQVPAPPKGGCEVCVYDMLEDARKLRLAGREARAPRKVQVQVTEPAPSPEPPVAHIEPQGP